MLINQFGIDDEDVMIDLDSRRVPLTVNPKGRVTMAMLLQIALSSFQTSDPIGTPTRRIAPVSHLNSTANKHGLRTPSSNESAA